MEKNIRGKQMWIWISNTAFFLANLRIYDLRIETQRIFVDLWFADYSLQICGFAICGLAHLRNLRIFDFGMGPRICRFAICRETKIICVPTFVNYQEEKSKLPCIAYTVKNY